MVCFMRLLVLFLMLMTAAFAGCLGDDDDASGDDDAMDDDAMDHDGDDMMMAAPVELSIATSGTYPLDPGFNGDLSAPAGATVNLTFTNQDQNQLVSHDWVLEGVEGASTAALGNDESATITFVAPSEAGAYTFFCSIGDHRDRGMEGTFTVTA